MNDRKRMLREKLRKEYLSLPEDYKSNVDSHIISNVQDFFLYKKCSRIFLFASHGSEICTYDLISVAFDSQKTVMLPKCHAKGVMDFFAYEGSFVMGKFGICEPTGTLSDVPNVDDIMIVPGLAFTECGARLGQGGGYYDRYLEKHPCITVGLCREKFLMKEIPTEWNDLPVDYVITEAGVYDCKKCRNGAS